MKKPESIFSGLALGFVGSLLSCVGFAFSGIGCSLICFGDIASSFGGLFFCFPFFVRHIYMG